MFIVALVDTLGSYKDIKTRICIVTFYGCGDSKSQPSSNTLCGFPTIMHFRQMVVDITATWQLPPTALVALHLWRTSSTSFTTTLTQKNSDSVWDLVFIQTFSLNLQRRIHNMVSGTSHILFVVCLWYSWCLHNNMMFKPEPWLLSGVIRMIYNMHDEFLTSFSHKDTDLAAARLLTH